MFTITDNADTNRTTAHIFKRKAQQAELELQPFDPETVSLADWTPASAADVREAAFNAAAAGKDPATDKTTQRLAISRLIGEQTGGLRATNDIKATRAELEHYANQAPALLKQLTSNFNEDVATIRDNLPTLAGAHPADLMSDLANMKPTKAESVLATYRANDRIARTVDSVSIIAAAANGRPLETSGPQGLIRWIDYSAAEYEQHMLNALGTVNNHNRKHNAYDAINDGLTLDLATTPEEVHRRMERFKRQRDNTGHDLKAEHAAHDLAAHQAKAMGIK